MEIKETRQGAVTIMAPGGPLVESDVPVFSARLQAVASRSLGRFILDLSGVPYVDSTGLEALYDAAENAGASGVTPPWPSSTPESARPHSIEAPGQSQWCQ